MVARKPGSPGRARRKPLKPFAQGMPERFRRTCGDLSSCAFLSCARGCGCAVAPGIPCALDFLGVSIGMIRAQIASRRCLTASFSWKLSLRGALAPKQSSLVQRGDSGSRRRFTPRDDEPRAKRYDRARCSEDGEFDGPELVRDPRSA